MMQFSWIQYFIPIVSKSTDTHGSLLFITSQKQKTRTSNLPLQKYILGSKQSGEHAYDKLTRFSTMWKASENHESIHNNRFGRSQNVDYGNSHPFERMQRQRNLFTQSNARETDSRRLQLNHWMDDAEYKPMRIVSDTTFLDLATGSDREKIHFLKNEVLPPAFEFWTKALRVFPLQQNLVVDEEFCPISDITQTVEGVANVDLLILLAVDVKAICDNGPLAAARSCQADQFDRPVVGTTVVCLDKLDLEDDATKDTYISVLIHELSHVLGMRAIDFAYYYDQNTGLPRTPRPLQAHNVSCVDGTTSEVILPSPNTIQRGRTKNGLLYYEVVTPTVKTVVRNQFNCQSMTGARLENQPTNDGNCFGSHWEAVSAYIVLSLIESEVFDISQYNHYSNIIPCLCIHNSTYCKKRLFASDLLSAIALQTDQFVTPMTLALLEDSGWYKPNYSVSKKSPFGNGRGCEFVYEDCIDDNGNVPEWGEGFFCNEKLGINSRLRCDGTLHFVSRCDLVDFDDYPHGVSPIFPYQYFKEHPVSTFFPFKFDLCFLTSFKKSYI